MALDQRLYQNGKEKEEVKDEGKIENGENEEENEDAVEDNSEMEEENDSQEEDNEDKPNGEVKKAFVNPNKDKGIVFVKNIDFDVNGDDFTEHFKAFDKIVWAKVI